MQAVLGMFPQFPGRFSTRIHLIQALFVLECIHTLPISIVPIADQLVLLDESLEWLNDEFFSRLDVAEDILLKNEVAAVYLHGAAVHALNLVHVIIVPQRDDMIAEWWSDTDATGYLVVGAEMLNIGCEW